MRSSLNSFSRIRTEITFTAYLQDSAFKVQLSQQTLHMSEEFMQAGGKESIEPDYVSLECLCKSI